MQLKKTKLIEMRLKRKINQDAMAVLVDMSQPTYSRKERGISVITSAEWEKIAEVLEVDKYEIYENSSRKGIFSGNMKKRNTIIPPDLLQEIEFLRKENLALKEEIRKLKNKKTN